MLDFEPSLQCSKRTTMKTYLLFILAFAATIGFSQNPDTLKPTFYTDPTYNPDYSFYDTYGNYEANGLYTLPCELLQFDVSSDNKGFVFSWATITETNTSFFAIEFLNQKGIWEHIDNVTASGNSNSIVEYSFSNNATFASGSIFRLVLTDNDGASRPIAMASANSINREQPNPISNFRVSSNNNSVNLLWNCNSDNVETYISVYSVNGQLLYSQKSNSTEGFNYFENIELSAGSSFIAVAETAYGNTVVKFGL